MIFILLIQKFAPVSFCKYIIPNYLKEKLNDLKNIKKQKLHLNTF